jgi:hypothetical protein
LRIETVKLYARRLKISDGLHLAAMLQGRDPYIEFYWIEYVWATRCREDQGAGRLLLPKRSVDPPEQILPG